MKRKIISLLLLIACVMSLSACSGRNFEFDENSAVKMEYDCLNPEDNFTYEPNSEDSKKIIGELNKISYEEETDKIDFGPSYDCLTIFVGTDRLDLADVRFITDDDNGGYFMFNNKLCKTTDSFAFLLDYIELPN